MDSDQGKLFIGGISWETSEDKLKDYFEQYGNVIQTVIMRDKVTGRPRGFGFVVFADPSVIDRVVQDKHTIDGRTVEAKRALSREEQQNTGRSGNNNGGRHQGSGGEIRTKKIFVGGLPPTLTEEGFREYFENYGPVADVVIMYDQNTQRPRGFGFISFDNEEAVDRVLQKTFHDLNGKQVEVKRAMPKDFNPGMGSRSMGGGGSGGSYQGSGNPNSYDSRMDSNRYMQSQNPGGAYGPYGSSGYGAAGYGYGPTNNGMGYGGYGAYGGANLGYGGPAGAGYGNPNVASAGYGNAPGAALRTSWNAQNAPGYGAVGYGGAAPWSANAGGGAPGSGPPGQSPSGGSGYGSQGYGYGSYGEAGYSNLGGRAGSTGSGAPGGAGGDNPGYMGSGHGGDANGLSGYGAGAWRSDPSQPSGTHGGYGGYGGLQTRQTQQQ